MPDPNAKHDARLATYAATATALSLLSDRRLGELLAAARPVGSGIGGSTAELDVEGARVFAKQVPLTELEQRSEHVMSTANLFGLPAFYQYPLGSAGFGAWRELASHVMTTNWVLAGGYQGFPLLYGWRVLPGSAAADAGMSFLGGIEESPFRAFHRRAGIRFPAPRLRPLLYRNRPGLLADRRRTRLGVIREVPARVDRPERPTGRPCLRSVATGRRDARPLGADRPAHPRLPPCLVHREQDHAVPGRGRRAFARAGPLMVSRKKIVSRKEGVPSRTSGARRARR